MESLKIVKIGGNVIDNESALQQFLSDFAQLKGNKILVHGGGKLATQLSEELGIKPNLVDGRRITDKATLKVVTMMYAGWVSKNLVASLQANKINALGMSGADMNLISAIKRPVKEIDYGYVGDVEQVNTDAIKTLIENKIVPVVCALTHDLRGQLLNTNADTIAAQLAIAASELYEVSLVYCFEKPGVMMDPEVESSLIEKIDSFRYQQLKQEGIIATGMLPKMHNCFQALEKGVEKVLIMHAKNLQTMNGKFIGTTLTL